MRPIILHDRCVLFHGDSAKLGDVLAENSVDAIVSDPPAAIGFMGKEWDSDKGGRDAWIAWLRDLLAPAYRALKPGGHALFWALPRTSHFTATAIEDAGFELRDTVHDLIAADALVQAFLDTLDDEQRVAFARALESQSAPILYQLFGQGFPKSTNVAIQLDALDAREERRRRSLAFTEWMRSTGITCEAINTLTASRMGSHYLTDKEQPHVATADMFDRLRPHLPAVPEWVEALVRERTVESENLKARKIIGHSTSGIASGTGEHNGEEGAYGFAAEFNIYEPHSDLAKRWRGWGTALKPAAEHWILARKPLAGTIAETIARHGTGAINIDACRIGTEQTVTFRRGHSGDHGAYGDDKRDGDRTNPPGRWPAHVVLEHAEGCGDACVEGCPVRGLDEQSGILKSGAKCASAPNRKNQVYGAGMGGAAGSVASTGGASRFYYIAKPPRREKDAGLDHLATKSGGEATDRKDGSAGLKNPRAGAGRTGGAKNVHPTVKSVDLMRWLVRLVTPPGGTVLDPFTGSGTTGIAALAEGASFVGVELTDEYIPIAEGRLRHALGEEPPAPADALSAALDDWTADPVDALAAALGNAAPSPA